MATLIEKRRRPSERSEGYNIYGVTIKGNSSRHYTKAEYYEIIKNSGNGLDWGEMFFELDSRNILHLHTTLTCKKSIWLKKLLKPGYNSNFQLLETAEDVNNWQNYIRKDQKYYDVELMSMLYNMGPLVF